MSARIIVREATGKASIQEQNFDFFAVFHCLDVFCLASTIVTARILKCLSLGVDTEFVSVYERFYPDRQIFRASQILSDTWIFSE